MRRKLPSGRSSNVPVTDRPLAIVSCVPLGTVAVGVPAAERSGQPMRASRRMKPSVEHAAVGVGTERGQRGSAQNEVPARAVEVARLAIRLAGIEME